MLVSCKRPGDHKAQDERHRQATVRNADELVAISKALKVREIEHQAATIDLEELDQERNAKVTQTGSAVRANTPPTHEPPS
jgi:hypothetical protein